MKPSTKHLAASGLASIALSLSANAAVMTWETPGAITADTDVRTTGTLVGAFTVGNGASAVTVNTVAFSAVDLPSAFDNTTTTSLSFGSVATLGGNPGLYGTANFETGTPSGLSGDYTTLLKNAVGPAAVLDPPAVPNPTANLATFTLTLTNLSIGQEYLFQTWVNESRAFLDIRSQTVTSGGNTSGTMEYNVPNGENGPGSYLVGTFTADAATQAITYNANDFAQINAFQVRAIPEPSTVAFLAAGLAGLVLHRRRRA